MGVTVSTSSTYKKLVLLSNVKTALGLTTSTAYDSHLDEIIDMASDSIRDQCNRTFRVETYTETLPGNGSQYIRLKRTPVVRVESLTLRGDSVTGYSIDDREAGTLYRELGWEWTVAAGLGTLQKYPIPDGDLLVFSAGYTAGFIMPEESSTFSTTSTAGVYPSLPGRIKKAALVTVVSWFKGSDRDEDIRSKKIGPLEITYASNRSKTGALPARAEALLSKWEEPYMRY